MRVNLLKKSEIRYQGIVTKKFLIIVPILTLLLGALIFVPIQIMKTSMEKSKKASLTKQLEQLNLLVERANKLENICNHNASVIDLLKQRAAHTLPVNQLLREIRQSVPPAIQLTVLSFTAKPKLVVDQTDAADAIQWPITLTLDGTAISTAPESIVIPFANRISDTSFIKQWFDTVNLIDFNRISSGSSLETAAFHIAGSGELKRRMRDEG